MKIFKATLVLFLLFSGTSFAMSPAPQVKAEIAILATSASKVEEMTTYELIDYYGAKYDVSTSTIHRVVKCESQYNPNAIGDEGTSFGLAQIHLPAHPEVSRAQALDPEFAISFLAKNLAKGKGAMWTCFN